MTSPLEPTGAAAVSVRAEILPRFDEILTADALNSGARPYGTIRATGQEWPQPFTTYAYDHYLVSADH